MPKVDTLVKKLLTQFVLDLKHLGVGDFVLIINDPDGTEELIRLDGSIYWQIGAALDIVSSCRKICAKNWDDPPDEGETEFN